MRSEEIARATRMREGRMECRTLLLDDGPRPREYTLRVVDEEGDGLWYAVTAEGTLAIRRASMLDRMRVGGWSVDVLPECDWLRRAPGVRVTRCTVDWRVYAGCARGRPDANGVLSVRMQRTGIEGKYDVMVGGQRVASVQRGKDDRGTYWRLFDLEGQPGWRFPRLGDVREHVDRMARSFGLIREEAG